MNNRFLKIVSLVACSTLFIAGCSEDNSSFETPNTSTTPANDSAISQKNFTILFSPTRPAYFDIANGTFTAVESEVSVQVGDNKNQIVTAGRTIFFRSEWGLIDPSCTTVDGKCSVKWRSGSPDDMPTNFLANILAYSHGGQESFTDLNGDGQFNDGDAFEDKEEPYVNVIENNTFDSTGDLIVDTINGLDLTGTNAAHDIGDLLYNGPNCSHSTLCSTTLSTATVWESGSLRLTGDTTFSVGGSITGLTGTLVLQNNGFDDHSVTTVTTFTFPTKLLPGQTYNVTVKTNPPGLTCTVTDGTGTANNNVTNVSIDCV